MMVNKDPYVLLVGTSLRSARYGKAKESLLSEIKKISSRDELNLYLKEQAVLHYDSFHEEFESEKSYFKRYQSFRKHQLKKGLSNSEVGLAAAAWELKNSGIKSEFFNVNELLHIDSFEVSQNEVIKLKKIIKNSAAIILSTPVYFGDRSSLAQLFIDLCYSIFEEGFSFENKFFAACSSGAKRNGGQETTLVYLGQDFLKLGFKLVGNDSQTTSQYGGTVYAGDLGTAADDEYGINTCLGTARRIARTLTQKTLGEESLLKKDVPIKKIRTLLLNFSEFDLATLNEDLKNNDLIFDCINVSNMEQMPCLACDICPTHIGPDDQYRCIIKNKKEIDATQSIHELFIKADLIIPIADNRSKSFYSYQRFMERTRYLRRGDYAWGDCLTIPFIIGSDNFQLPTLHFRLTTSFMRHHTIISRAQSIKKLEELTNRVKKIIKQEIPLILGRYLLSMSSQAYQPLGYYLSSAKDKEDFKKGLRHKTVNDRAMRFKERLNDIEN